MLSPRQVESAADTGPPGETLDDVRMRCGSSALATSDESDDGNENTESERKSGANRGKAIAIERRRLRFERRRSYEER